MNMYLFDCVFGYIGLLIFNIVTYIILKGQQNIRIKYQVKRVLRFRHLEYLHPEQLQQTTTKISGYLYIIET